MPQMLDPNFSGTITYICEHSEQDAMGLVSNRPVEFNLNELLEQLDITFDGKEHAIFAGGPVQQDRGFILHSSDKIQSGSQQTSQQDWESTLQVAQDIQLTTSKDILGAIAEGKGPDRFLIALGYAGWGEASLNRSWLKILGSAVLPMRIFCFVQKMIKKLN